MGQNLLGLLPRHWVNLTGPELSGVAEKQKRVPAACGIRPVRLGNLFWEQILPLNILTGLPPRKNVNRQDNQIRTWIKTC